MAPSRTSRRRTTRGPSSRTGTAQPRSNISVTTLSLTYGGLAESFEKKFKKRKIVKQYVYFPLVVERMRIPDVVERLNVQRIDLFLECTTKYNEDLVKLFYTDVVGNFECYEFKYNIGNRVLEVNDDVWKSLFKISPLSSPDDLKITDNVFAPNYEFKFALNSMLKRPYSDNVVASNLFLTSATTGLLKHVDRILHWVVLHIIRPKMGGYSRVYKAEVHLIYVLKHKVKVNWPHYIASMIFALKESGRGIALCYPSFIQSILNRAEVFVARIQCTFVSTNQESCQKSLSLMGYIWDLIAHVYKV